ncbi:MAG TPA: ABC transporter ATP-binding protein [Sphingobium sp.]|nr:ABC transporter ATP-binding protein [Sphingobium sp.]
MLAAYEVVVRAGSRALLAGISAALKPGRVTAVLGPNGAGKSTLLQCLAGLRTPAGGEVRLDAVSLHMLGAQNRAKRIGYLPQQAQLHWNIHVHALVALGRYPLRARYGPLSAADEAMIAGALARMDAAHLAGRQAGTLSGGELARVLLARVLAGEPDWILADEPFAALDVAHRFDLAAHLRAIAAAGTGVVVVLHDVALAGRLADDILLLDKGRLVASGPAATVLDGPELEQVFGVSMDRHVHEDGTVSLIPVRRFS